MLTRAFTPAALLAMVLVTAADAQGPPQRFTTGGRDIVRVDIAGTAVGDFPAGIQMIDGIMEVVDFNGQRLLRASSRSSFLVRLPQVLPQDFTLEFEIVPKAGGNPEDLAVEGTPQINQSAGSANVMWHRDYLQIVGGGPTYDSKVPPTFAAGLPSSLTHVAITMQGSTMKLFTNGRLMYTQTRQFARTRVLRVFLGGQDDGTNAVYLAGMGVIDGVAAVGPLVGPTLGQTPPRPPPTPLPTESQSQATGGGPGRVVSVSVAQGTTGPLVTWTRLGGATFYTVRRWKIDDPTCCNATSPALPGAPWQDGALPAAGTYVFEVTASTPTGIATGQAQFIQFATRKGIATVAQSDSGAAGTTVPSRSPGATESPTPGGNPAGAAAATLFSPPAPRTITLTAISASGLPRLPAPAARTITLAEITATGGQGSGAIPSPRTIALGEIIAKGAVIAVKAPTGAIAGLPGTNEGSAVPAPRTIQLTAISGSGGGGMARVPAARSMVLGGFSAAGAEGQTTHVPPRTITLPALTASGSGKTP